jgi:hypothetical protein
VAIFPSVLKNGISILTGRQTHEQANQAMAHTSRLGKLSVLAYFYIPITLPRNFYFIFIFIFGLNFAELGPDLSIWSFFVTAVTSSRRLRYCMVHRLPSNLHIHMDVLLSGALSKMGKWGS